MGTVPLWRSNVPGSNYEEVNEDSPLPVQVVPPTWPLAPVYISASGTAGAGAITLTLPGVLNKTTWIQGFIVTGLGATAASTIAVTITGLQNTLTFYFTVALGATVADTPLVIPFSAPIPASAPNTAIVVNVPSFGGGNTNAAASAWGFQL